MHRAFTIIYWIAPVIMPLGFIRGGDHFEWPVDLIAYFALPYFIFGVVWWLLVSPNNCIRKLAGK